MELETIYNRRPVNGIFASKPEGKINYRYINSTDTLIYNIDGAGNETAEDKAPFGARLEIIGDQSEINLSAKFLNNPVLEEIKTQYFPAGYSRRVVFTFFWHDRIVILRNNPGVDSDMLIVYPDGNTSQYIFPGTGKMTCYTIDARKSLWIGFDETGVYKFMYDDTLSAPDHYDNTNTGILPSDKTQLMCAAGLSVFIIQGKSNTCFIVRYDGKIFVDDTTKFTTDTGVSLSSLTSLSRYSMCEDGGNVYWTMDDVGFASGRWMFYHDATADKYYVRTMGTTLTTAKVWYFVKAGNYIYSRSVNTGYHAYIYSWIDLSIAYTGSVCIQRVRTDGKIVIWLGAESSGAYHFYTAQAGNSTVTQDPVKEAELLAYITARGATCVVCDLGMSPYDVVLTNDDSTITTILRYVLTPMWVVK